MQTFYVLSKIDFESKKFIEVKRIKSTLNEGCYGDINNAYKALGISATGELSNDANVTVETGK